MDPRSILTGAAAGAVAGLLLGLLFAPALERGDADPAAARGAPAAAAPVAARGAELGDAGREIGSLRVTVETDVANGASTTHPIMIWLDNRGHRLSKDPIADFGPGRTASVVLSSHIPRTVGELRAASIVLTLALERAAISASWKCRVARLEVRLAGEEQYVTYLSRDDVGWLSLDEPPRRSLAFALQ